MFLIISHYSQKHTCVGVSFLKSCKSNYLKRNSSTGVFLWIFEKFVRAAFLIKHITSTSEEPMAFSIYLKIGYCLICLLLAFLKLCYFFVLAVEIRPCDALLLSFRNHCYASYKQFTRWIHSWLGKGMQKVIPSCVVWSIRKNYPSENDIYTEFKQAENNYGYTGNTTVLLYNSERPKNTFMIKKLLIFRKIHYFKHKPNLFSKVYTSFCNLIIVIV